MRSHSRELEIKLELTSQQVSKIRAHMRSTISAASNAPVRAKLHTTYFDTLDCALRSHGLSLRVRQMGEVRIQTLKAGQGGKGGVFNPIELEAEIAGDMPSIDLIGDKKLRRKVAKLIRGGALHPLFTIDIARETTLIETASTDRIEIALDTGTVVAGSQKGIIREVEIELKSGNPASLTQIVRELLISGPLRPSSLSKADRGFRLIGKASPADWSLRKPAIAAIDDSMTAGTALIEIFRVTTEHALLNWQRLAESGEAEHAHQLRVGLRRFRAACRILGYAGFDGDISALATQARDVGRIVGKLRDIDVLKGSIVEPISSNEHIGATLPLLLSRLRSERKSCVAQVRTALETPECGLFQIDLGILEHRLKQVIESDSKRASVPASALAERSLERLLRRVEKRANHLSDLSIEQRHQLRKSIKPFRYAFEFFAPFYSRSEAKKLQACLAELQATLGYLNDVALADSLLKYDWSRGKDRSAIDIAVGAIVGWHSSRADQAWNDVKSTWKKFEHAAAIIRH